MMRVNDASFRFRRSTPVTVAPSAAPVGITSTVPTVTRGADIACVLTGSFPSVHRGQWGRAPAVAGAYDRMEPIATRAAHAKGVDYRVATMKRRGNLKRTWPSNRVL